MLFVSGVVLVAVAGMVLSQDKAAPGKGRKLTTPHESQAAASASKPNAAADYPVIGYLEKRDRTITIKSGPEGPLYSVKTAEGKVLCENLSADQLRAQVPEIHEFLQTAVACSSGTKADARVRIKVDASLRDRPVR